MQPDYKAEGQRREAMLAVMLAVLGGVFALVLLTGGFLLYLLLAAAGVAVLGGLHYLLWGRLMSEETAGEREEAELRDRAELQEWDLPEPRRPRH
jgi:hypothetical protein